MTTVSTCRRAPCCLSVLLSMVFGATITTRLSADPPPGSDENSCAMCHTDPDLWSKDTLHLYIDKEGLNKDVHWQRGVKCRDCHGGNSETTEVNLAHAVENGFRPLDEVKNICANCHQEQALGIIKGVHSTAVEKGKTERGGPLACEACHGKNTHKLLPVSNPDSPVYGNNQVQTCGGMP